MLTHAYYSQNLCRHNLSTLTYNISSVVISSVALRIISSTIAKEKLHPHKPMVERAASYVLSLPRKILDISVLNTSRIFREFGNKEGAVAAIELLQESGIGVVHTEKATRGTSKVRSSFIHACTLVASQHQLPHLVWKEIVLEKCP